jgi:hypothetical protein
MKVFLDLCGQMALIWGDSLHHFHIDRGEGLCTKDWALRIFLIP